MVVFHFIFLSRKDSWMLEWFLINIWVRFFKNIFNMIILYNLFFLINLLLLLFNFFNNYFYNFIIIFFYHKILKLFFFTNFVSPLGLLTFLYLNQNFYLLHAFFFIIKFYYHIKSLTAYSDLIQLRDQRTY